mmetsp:Transcript_22580/g.49006  ORF Transcript_22580/g.49006 Transcript_22580/m.49006 type:complete len:257 (-) Transcript_22580:520-1290(-)
MAAHEMQSVQHVIVAASDRGSGARGERPRWRPAALNPVATAPFHMRLENTPSLHVICSLAVALQFVLYRSLPHGRLSLIARDGLSRRHDRLGNRLCGRRARTCSTWAVFSLGRQQRPVSRETAHTTLCIPTQRFRADVPFDAAPAEIRLVSKDDLGGGFSGNHGGGRILRDGVGHGATVHAMGCVGNVLTTNVRLLTEHLLNGLRVSRHHARLHKVRSTQLEDQRLSLCDGVERKGVRCCHPRSFAVHNRRDIVQE